MGDRFYMQQAAFNGKPKSGGPKKEKRRLKKDILEEIDRLLADENLPSMSKMTIVDLEKLEATLKEIRNA